MLRRALLLITLTATLAGCGLEPRDATLPVVPSADSRSVRVSPSSVRVSRRSEHDATRTVLRFGQAFASWLHGNRSRDLPRMANSAERHLRAEPPRLPAGERRGPASVEPVELVFQTRRSGVFAIHVLGPSRATIWPGTIARRDGRWRITGMAVGR